MCDFLAGREKKRRKRRKEGGTSGFPEALPLMPHLSERQSCHIVTQKEGLKRN